MKKRFKELLNQRRWAEDLWHDNDNIENEKIRLKEQPQTCSCPECCGNARQVEGPTIQERKFFEEPDGSS